MAENSKIEWTHHTFNPWMGCTKVSAGCAHCYAETLMDTRYGKTKWGPHGLRVIKAESGWKEPARWNREAIEAGERRRVFCASLADVFEGDESMPADARQPVKDARKRLFDLIYSTPGLDWLLLTKRPQNAYDIIGGESGTGWTGFAETFHNVWLGTSVEDQAAADQRIPELMKCEPAIRFLSCEPLLDAVQIESIPTFKWNTTRDRRIHEKVLAPECWGDCDCNAMWGHDDGCRRNGGDGTPTRRVDWVIVGGESGANARPMHPQWARSLRDQCQDAGVPFLFKQWGEWCPAPRGSAAHDLYLAGGPKAGFFGEDGQWAEWDRAGYAPFIARVGKGKAGRLLDGREWNEFPVPLSSK